MSVIIESDGKKFEFRGEYRKVRVGDWFLTTNGGVIKNDFALGILANPVAILHLIPPILEFGGIKFVKTGEFRYPVPGEWYLSDRTNGPVFRTDPIKSLSFKAAILKPSEKEEEGISPHCSIHYAPKHVGEVPSSRLSCTRAPTTNIYSILLSEETVKSIVRAGYVPQYDADQIPISEIELEIVKACKEAFFPSEFCSIRSYEHAYAYAGMCYCGKKKL